jgi:voltage-dependent calcium channel L type alpha-1D
MPDGKGKATNDMDSTDQLGDEGEIHQESWSSKKKKDLDRINRRMRRGCRRAVKSQAFYWLIIVLVFLNTGVLATEHYGQSAWLDQFQGLCFSRLQSFFELSILFFFQNTQTYSLSLCSRWKCFLKCTAWAFKAILFLCSTGLTVSL